jgi:hypothetical protein
MFPVQITLHNAGQLNAVLAALNAGEVVAQQADKPINGEVRGISHAHAAADVAPGKNREGASVEPPTETVAADISYDVVAKAITDKVKVDRAHAVATLAKFGAKKGPDLKAEQYADFLKALG